MFQGGMKVPPSPRPSEVLLPWREGVGRDPAIPPLQSCASALSALSVPEPARLGSLPPRSGSPCPHLPTTLVELCARAFVCLHPG